MEKLYLKQLKSILREKISKSHIVMILGLLFFACNAGFAQCPTNTREVIVVTEHEQIAKINVDTGAVNVLCTLPNEGYGYGDIAISPTGEIYVIVLSPSSTGRTSNLYRVNTSNCSRTYIGTLPFDGGNSLSFLPDGTLLAGSSDDGNTDSRVFRVTDLNNFTYEVWADFGSVYPAGDYVYLNGKIYVAWDVTGNDSSTRLFEVTVDENFDYVSHTIVDPAITYVYGLATVCGGQIVAGADNHLFFVDENTGAETPISWSSGTLGDLFGLTSYAESDPSVCLSDSGAAPDLTVTNNTCAGGAGSFNVTSETPPNSVLEYSTNGGSFWSTVMPTYDNNNAITVLARYSSLNNSGCFSAEGSITSSPAVCSTTLSLGKSASPNTTFEAGDVVTYTVTVANNGDVDATNVSLIDALPDGVTYVPNSLERTYWEGQSGSSTQTGTYTHTFTSNDCFGTSGATQSVTLSSAQLPAGAILTGYSYNVSVKTNDYLSDISLVGGTPSGTAFTLSAGSFGGDHDNSQNPVTKSGSGSVSGSAFGTYTFVWDDDYNGDNLSCGKDNKVNAAEFTITYEYTVSNSRSQTTDNPNSGFPATIMSSSEGISLKPGETMTITYQATVDDPATIDSITNTVTLNSDQTNEQNAISTITVNICKAGEEAPVIQ